MLGVAVVCAETDERAEWLAGSSKLAFVRLRSGRPGLYPTPEEAAGHEYTPHEEALVRSWLASHVVGSPDTVSRSLQDLVERTGADELMVTTMVHDPAERRRSYELLAEVAELQPPAELAQDAVV
jgi:alkanesulfonate monooxygenase SsuD/methylene tetrahydromethanopterin reductase-like flavin-dependent oxidoreductase (luciferase family)